MTEKQLLHFIQLKPLYTGGILSSAALADNVGVSRRQIQRLIQTPPAVRKPAWNRLPKEVTACILQTAAERFTLQCVQNFEPRAAPSLPFPKAIRSVKI